MTLPAPQLLALGLLVLAVVLAWGRLLRGPRAPRLRLVLRLLLQPALAALLYFGLFPPAQPTTGSTTLLVYSDAWTLAATPAVKGLQIALPEAQSDVPAEAKRVPDLATALRLHPQLTQLLVLGNGLPARDMDAARGYALRFYPAPSASGLVALQAPTRSPAGNAINVQGRVQGLQGGSVELFDPAAALQQRQILKPDGRFALQATTRSSGLMNFTLKVLDAQGRLHEQLPIPVEVHRATPLRLLVLAGSASPELKYLRRWAKDSGIALHTRIDAGAGITLGDAPVVLDANTLRRFDAVLLDTRSLQALQALQAPEWRALLQALRDGLGVLVRLDAPPSPTLQTRLQAAGIPTQRAPGTTSSALLHNAQGKALGQWFAIGRGRIGLLPVADTYTLVLQGQTTQHAQLWSSALANIARSLPANVVQAPPAPLWAGERAEVCGITANGTVSAVAITPNAQRIPLLLDPATGSRRCAAFWPQQSGWYRLQQAATQQAFFVLPANVAPAWRLQRRQDATAALALQPATARHAKISSSANQPGLAWPWLLSWLLLTTLAWWLERYWRASATTQQP